MILQIPNHQKIIPKHHRTNPLLIHYPITIFPPPPPKKTKKKTFISLFLNKKRKNMIYSPIQLPYCLLLFYFSVKSFLLKRLLFISSQKDKNFQLKQQMHVFYEKSILSFEKPKLIVQIYFS